MLIRVKYVDDRFDMVRPEILDRLLEAGKVREFQRSDGWVMPGIANLRRKKSRSGDSVPERRKMWGEERRVQE